MGTRRKFITSVGAGIIANGLLPPGLWGIHPGETEQRAGTQEKIVIGIIGAENSHAINFGRLFNLEQRFPGVSVGYIWGETEEFARKAMKAGFIPEMVREPYEMLGRIDALIVDHRHAKYHIPAATPFVKAGIPVFIDKPFCYRAEEGKAFLQLARFHGTPVTSYSSLSRSKSIEDIRKQVDAFSEISQVVMYGPVDINSKWGGIFFYGVHMIEQLMAIFGEEINKVRVTRSGGKANATLVYSNGMLVTLIFSNFNSGWTILVETETGYHELKSRVWDDDPKRADTEMVHMFRTGEEPRSYQSMLNGVSILEALEESSDSELWVNVKYLYL